MGGRGPGLIAGIVASFHVMHAHFEQIGPHTLTGNLWVAMGGSALYIATGFLLGMLRDQRDQSFNTLRNKELSLKAALDGELVKKGKQVAKIAESEARLQQAVKVAGLGHVVFDAINDRCEYCSKEHAAFAGLTPAEYIQRSLSFEGELSSIHPDDRDYARTEYAKLRKGERIDIEYRIITAAGDTRHVRIISEPVFDADGKVVKEISTSFDITELRQTETQLRQAQKMEAIGKLTGGMAHDFNNLLAVILGNLELLDDLVTNEGEKDLVRNSIEATLRGAELTRNMLSFAQKAPLQPTIVDLNHLVRNIKNWTARTLPATIEVETSLLAGLWPVKVDVSSAESGLLNLLLNARDAMPDGGKLTIETSNIRIDEDYLEQRGETIEPGRYVLLAVSDTGEGIHPENLAKIYEPFFTTKRVGEGTGLGLSMLEGFMKQSGGTIRVYSEPGVGTTFKLYFSAMDVGENEPAALAPEPQDNAENRATILLVEDNSEVLAAMRLALMKVGYHVLVASSGDEALRVFQGEPGIELLLTDIVMPGKLQGTTLAKTLRELQPDLPVVFMSGYASEATVHGNGLRPEDIRLMKPVQRADLLRAIDKALSQGPFG